MKLTDASAHKCLLKGISSYGPKKFVMYGALLLTKKSFCDFCIGGHKIRIHIPSFLGSKKQSNVKNTENCALCACLMIRIRMKYQIDQSSFLVGSGSPSIPVECMCESYKLTRKSYQIETTQNK